MTHFLCSFLADLNRYEWTISHTKGRFDRQLLALPFEIWVYIKLPQSRKFLPFMAKIRNFSIALAKSHLAHGTKNEIFLKKTMSRFFLMM